MQPSASSCAAVVISIPLAVRPSGANASAKVVASNFRMPSRGQGAGRPNEPLRSWASSIRESSSSLREAVTIVIARELLGEIEDCRQAAHRVFVDEQAALDLRRDQLASLLGGGEYELQTEGARERQSRGDTPFVHLPERFVQQDHAACRLAVT